MKKNRVFIFSILIFAILISCTPDKMVSEKPEINIIVSIIPQKTFVEAVGGEYINVDILIPPGGSPATYEPKPADLVKVEEADIYFRIGYIPFERSHVQKFAELNSDMKIVDTSVEANLRYFGEHEHHHHGEEHHHAEHDHHDKEIPEEKAHDQEIDPHIWLSPLEVKKQIDIIAQTLASEDPENKADYERNAKVYKTKLNELYIDIRGLFAELKYRNILVFHPAWGYFAREFGLDQVAIEDSGKEPTAEHLKEVIDLARKEDIKVIFVQSQFNTSIANSIAEEIGAEVISIDPLAGNYIDSLRSTAEKIAESLKN